jgi:phosphatidylserine/phosphatidylglycerophosphate/cardiolipin synthase-like enzyme
MFMGCAHRALPRVVGHRASTDSSFCDGLLKSEPSGLDGLITEMAVPEGETGVLMLERGASALIARAWLLENATQRIDAQYFIFASDNTGLVVTDALLRAAKRGVKVRLLVDDTLSQGDPEVLQALSVHPNAEVRIYNPVINVGRSTSSKIKSVLSDFRGVNQRMHNKLFLADGRVAITGGRNVAGEYFDLKYSSNFRDRDVLLIDGEVADAQASFEQFWAHPLAQPIEGLIGKPLPYAKERIWAAMHEYACDPKHFLPMIRQRVAAVPASLRQRVSEGQLSRVARVEYVSDVPGKNTQDSLTGGGISTDALIALVRTAKESLVIQSPYLVTTQLGLGVFAEAEARGVQVRILTNSLAATDNVMAFAGYRAGSDALLEAGVELYEVKPDPAIKDEVMNGPAAQRRRSSMALHAKSMVIDGKVAVVGSFNLDPRSANLNTESVTVIYSQVVAQHILERMETEMGPDNAWQVTKDYNPDKEASVLLRLKALVSALVPIELL